jgi:accessory gene regulator protein AgrB
MFKIILDFILAFIVVAAVSVVIGFLAVFFYWLLAFVFIDSNEK